MSSLKKRSGGKRLVSEFSNEGNPVFRFQPTTPSQGASQEASLQRLGSLKSKELQQELKAAAEQMPSPGSESGGSTRSCSSGSEDDGFTRPGRDVEEFLKETADPNFRFRLMDKIVFVFSFANIVATCWGVFRAQWFLPHFYTVKFFTLLLLRFIYYRQSKNHFFLLDFCYFANALILVYMWIFPGCPRLFAVCFGVATGPLVVAVLAFRNSLVLHSLDKMTSLFIHVSPALLLYSIRFFPEAASASWHSPFVPLSPEYQWDVNFQAAFWWSCVVPLFFFVAHACFYWSLMLTCLNSRRKAGYMTSYRFLTGSKKGIVFKVVNVGGKSWRKVMGVLVNTVYCFLTLIPCPLLIRGELVCVSALVIQSLIYTWNGANFYMEVFAVKYQHSKKLIRRKAEHLIRKASMLHQKGMSPFPGDAPEDPFGVAASSSSTTLEKVAPQ